MTSAAVLCFCLFGLLERANSVSHNVGYIPATINEFPYYASIEVNGTYACGATIIDDKYVMTTYSCVEGIDFELLGVRVGTSRLGHRGVFLKVVDVSYYSGNPFYPDPGVQYDIAMVKVAVPFKYNPHVMWANPNADGIAEYQEGSVVGWANNKERGSPLIAAHAYVLPSDNCSQIYAGVMNISEGMYCLWPSEPDNSPCIADKGAPFYLNEQYYGMVTYAPGCDVTDKPVVITGIAKFTSFIIMVLCDMEHLFGSSLLPKSVNADSFNLEQLSMKYSHLAM